MAQTALNRGDERTKALRETLAELLSMDEPRRRYAAMMSGLDIRYDLGAGHPLLGAGAAPSAVLIRPDGQGAWVGGGTDDGLGDALSRWFGAPQ